MAKIAALVPMRHKSERVVGKNYREFAGKPLFYWIVESLLGAREIDQVVIDTDSPKIKRLVKTDFGSKNVMVIDRPAELVAGEVPMNEILKHDTKQVEADYYVQTHSTNPLLSSKTISKAVKEFLEKKEIYDSLFGVTRLQTRLWDQLARPINHNKNILLRTQDLPPVYEENSNLYIFSKTVLEETGNRIGKRPLMFEIDPTESVDIDKETDFLVAEYLYKLTKKK